MILTTHKRNVTLKADFPETPAPILAAVTLWCGHALKSDATWHPQRSVTPNLLLLPPDML